MTQSANANNEDSVKTKTLGSAKEAFDLHAWSEAFDRRYKVWFEKARGERSPEEFNAHLLNILRQP